MERQGDLELDYPLSGTGASPSSSPIDRIQTAEIRLAVTAAEIGNRALELFTNEELAKREKLLRHAGELLLIASRIFKTKEEELSFRQAEGFWGLSEKDTANRILHRIPLAMYEVLTALDEGASRARIAAEFGLSEEFISRNMRSIYEMLEVNQPGDAIAAITALVRLGGHGDLLDQEIPEEDPKDSLHEVFAELSVTELDILGCVCLGLANKQIAQARFVTEQTIKFHLTSIYRKLDVHNRTAAAALASRGGLVEWAAYQQQGMNATRRVILEKSQPKS